ncbi:MAG: polyketide cyclase [Candidatus Peribacteria bacterium]|nr:polyketide cyclase [Candidatus Peribacteria bacterium]
MTTVPADTFTTSRTFNAPLAAVWSAFTDADKLTKWWGPKDFAMNDYTLDFRSGGVFLYSMTPPGASAMWGKFIYEEIEPMKKITFINSFSDADGGVTRNPWNPTWPLEVHNTLMFEEVDGHTTLTLVGGPINASEEEIKMFGEGTADMTKGFNGTWDQLEEFLKNS